MKHPILFFFFYMLFQSAGSAQRITTFTPPAGFTTHVSNGWKLTRDTAGEIWFGEYLHYASNAKDTFMVANMSNTKKYLFPATETVLIPVNSYWETSFQFDADNNLWWVDGNVLRRIKDGVINFSDTFALGRFFGLTCDGKGNMYRMEVKEHVNPNGQGTILDSVLVYRFHGDRYVDTTEILGIGLDLSPLPYTSNTWYTLFTDRANNLYLTMDLYHIIKFDGINWSVIFTKLWPEGMAIDGSGTLFGKDGSGVYKLLPNGQWQNLYYQTVGNIVASDLVCDFYGRMWMVGDETFCYGASGLTRFDDLGQYWNVCQYINDPYSIFDNKNNLVLVCLNDCYAYYRIGKMGSLTGRVFLDDNMDSIQNGNERGAPGVYIKESKPDNLTFVSDVTGEYEALYVDSFANHYLIGVAPTYYHFTTADTFIVNPMTDTGCCFNFGLAKDSSVQDLQINFTGCGAIPARNTYQWLSYRNVGSVPVSDKIIYQYDSLLKFVASEPMPSSVDSNLLVWNFDTLQPFQSGNIYMEFKVDSGAKIGDVIYGHVSIGPMGLDITPADNELFFDTRVSNSFDPNAKTVEPIYSVKPGDRVNYTVFFQNTGTASAKDVVIRDMLDDNLDPTTLEVTGYSHPLKYKLNGGNVVEFRFTDINLPDSNSHEALSHGFVKFSIRVRPGTNAKAKIYNTASIYFDLNVPIQTNSALLALGVISSVGKPVGELSFQLYPNPTATMFTIKAESLMGELTLFDLSGKAILTQQITSGSTTVDVSSCSAGLYLVAISMKGRIVGRQKLVVQ